MTQTCRRMDLDEGFKWEKGASKEDVAQLYSDLKQRDRLLLVMFKAAWKADRGRQDPELMAAYVETQRILGLTKEEIEELEGRTVQAEGTALCIDDSANERGKQ